MRVLKIIGDIDINTSLPDDAEIFDVKMNDYLVTEYEQKFDMIFCIHTLQTLWADQVTGAVNKLVNDLADGGELYIHVPATEIATKAMIKGVQDPVAFYMVWGSKERPYHTGFNLMWLRALVENEGAIIRNASSGKFKITSGGKESVGAEHMVVATIIRS